VPHYIASIYPIQLEAERQFSAKLGGGYAKFVMPAGSVERPSVLEINDHYQQVYMGMDIGYQQLPILSADIANDLYKNWSNGLAADMGFGPGVFLCETRVPSREEIAAANESQLNYFRYLVQKGNEAAAEDRPDKISHLHRLAAKEMGQEHLDWTRPMRQVKLKDCPLCTTPINAKASVCPNCKRDIGDSTPDGELAAVGGKKK
jgi:hypothetical protein